MSSGRRLCLQGMTRCVRDARRNVASFHRGVSAPSLSVPFLRYLGAVLMRAFLNETAASLQHLLLLTIRQPVLEASLKIPLPVGEERHRKYRNQFDYGSGGGETHAASQSCLDSSRASPPLPPRRKCSVPRRRLLPRTSRRGRAAASRLFSATVSCWRRSSQVRLVCPVQLDLAGRTSGQQPTSKSGQWSPASFSFCFTEESKKSWEKPPTIVAKRNARERTRVHTVNQASLRPFSQENNYE